MSKKKNYSSNKFTSANREAKMEARKLERQAADKKQRLQLVIGVGAVIAVVAVLSLIFISYYSETVVARINGANIYEREVQWSMNVARNNVDMHVADDADATVFQRAVQEEAVHIVARDRLFEDFGARAGIESTNPGAIVNAIIADPELFAEFEHLMPPLPSPNAEERAQAILDRIQAGEDFDTLMFEYSQDPGLWGSPTGYTFLGHQFVPEFTDATLAMEIGEISGLVESIHGFHIIMRTEPDLEADMHGAEFEEEELLGAKHILISDPTEEARMREAINYGFQEKLDNADIQFRNALYNVE